LNKLILVCLIIGLIGCGKSQEEIKLEKEAQAKALEQEKLKKTEEGTLIPRSVQGDKGEYYLLNKQVSGDVITTLHKRIGVDSVGYTAMNINCKTAQVQEVGYSEISADSITPNPTDWYELVPGSSKYDLYKFVCN